MFFRQDVGFVQAMDKAFTKFINENRVTAMAKTNTKSPELLARYCDILLRKSSRNPDEVEMDTLLNDIVRVFIIHISHYQTSHKNRLDVTNFDLCAKLYFIRYPRILGY